MGWYGTGFRLENLSPRTLPGIPQLPGTFAIQHLLYPLSLLAQTSSTASRDQESPCQCQWVNHHDTGPAVFHVISVDSIWLGGARLVTLTNYPMHDQSPGWGWFIRPCLCIIRIHMLLLILCHHLSCIYHLDPSSMYYTHFSCRGGRIYLDSYGVGPACIMFRSSGGESCWDTLWCLQRGFLVWVTGRICYY